MLLVSGVMAAAAVVVMLACPETGIGRALNRWLVEAPARGLNRFKRGEAAFYALLAILGLTLILLFETDGARLFGFLLPDTLVWFAMFDVGVFIDALLITGAIVASNGLRAVRAQVSAAPRRIAAVVAHLATRARRPRRRPSRPTVNPSDDDRPARAVQSPYLAFSMA